ncbi:MAG TPA: prolipoprotein diacylglyceryl transferase family protein [Acidobacteriota bacterium]|nr:prolipoprotein diacylglyceryl transferase family protein [Acidobacteriota bacterium]
MSSRQLLSINRLLDALVRPYPTVLGRPRSSFQVCGWIGLLFFMAQLAGLTLYLDLPLWSAAVLLVTSMITFLTLPMMGKIISGRESLTSFHHKVAVLAAAGIVLWMLGQPVLMHLDVLILSVGLFVACGRIGCLMVGCCHGRPHRWGVCYGEEHSQAGFTPYLVGVRLFPIQLIESLWIFAIVAAGNALVVSGAAPGQALCWYALSYCAGRFFLEFLRGDPTRPFYGGFSRAQWTCVLLMALVVLAGSLGLLPYRWWHLAAGAGVAAGMGAAAIGRRLRQDVRHRLLHPHHCREIASILDRINASPSGEPAHEESGATTFTVEIGCSSLGVRLSGGRTEQGGERMEHYSLSARDGAMEEARARIVADLILQLKPRSKEIEFFQGRRGVFHLLLRGGDPQRHPRHLIRSDGPTPFQHHSPLADSQAS